MSIWQRFLQFIFGERSFRPAEPPPTFSPAVPPSLAERPTTAEAPRLTIPEASADPDFAADAGTHKDGQPKLAGKAVDPLDAGAYLPISREEIKREAKGKNLFNNFAFGNRSIIPPADDLRTKLIDRAMVTHGLLSPEQLHEIHAVGARMDELRPTMAAVEHKAAKAGEAAVEADREARARLKAQKKAEAIERKRLRAEGIAYRRATDIVFLGRGVSGRLGDRTCDASKLEAADLPVIATPTELAAALGVSVPRLRWLAFHNEAATRVHYVQFTVPKKSGGTRTLSAPHRSLAEAQDWIFREILARLPVEPPAHGFVTGRSILTNASPHCGKRIVVNMDLEGFFPSIGFARVRSVFQRLGYSPAAATILGLLCTESPRRSVVYDGVAYHVATGPRGLPQGASTSPALSNQVARRLDRRLSGLSTRLGLAYTRYADDLTFSGDEAFEGRVGYLMARVRHFAAEEGFAVNEAKSRILRQGTAQTVTGLVVNDRPGVRREEVRRLRAILHRARTEGLEAQNREGRPDFLAWLRGKIAFVAMARPETGALLKAELEALLAG
ncbi:reverse transcriptase family protein [Paludisphaera rhizosphaerae]|uniref:reverse transcriptase family protein n=1 Tax=Paludisphaera rhizosphaerae TaxID=2711216 RepID=UPI0013EC1E37|nr:reverse transcriptase family protein [Paludisphaera rhizosphaerae]